MSALLRFRGPSGGDAISPNPLKIWALIMASATLADDVPGRSTYATEALEVCGSRPPCRVAESSRRGDRSHTTLTSGACAMASGPWDPGAPSPDISCMPCLYVHTPCSIWFSRRSLAPGCGRTCPSPWKHRGHSATEMMLKLIFMMILQGPAVKSSGGPSLPARLGIPVYQQLRKRAFVHDKQSEDGPIPHASLVHNQATFLGMTRCASRSQP